MAASARPNRRGRWFPRSLWGWIWRLLLLAIVADLVYLALIWPDWRQYREGDIPKSSFMRAYERERAQKPEWPPLRWRPVSIDRIPTHLQRAVVVAEDSRFYSHGGIDFEALEEAMRYNLSQKRMAYGASTLSQQTVKNLFLSPSRNPLRKWHELILTYAMEQNLSKRRILELYLNLAEFGRGVYGVDAAARLYWDVPVQVITVQESIELAATLPSPVSNNPASNSRSFQRRVKRIHRHFGF